MKLFIVVTGLALVSQLPNDKGIEILFLDSAGQHSTCNDSFPEHRLTACYWEPTRSGPQQVCIPMWDTDRVNLEIEVIPGQGEVQLDSNWGRAFDLGSVTPDTHLRSSCMGPGALEKCKNGNQRLLSGRIRLNGGSIQVAEVSHAGTPIRRKKTGPGDISADRWTIHRVPESGDLANQKFVTVERWCFAELGKKCAENSYSQKLFNAVLYEINSDSNSITVTLDYLTETDVTFSLEPVALDQCKDLESNPCMLLVLENNPPRNHRPPSCLFTRSDGEHCMVDWHQQLAYKALDPETDAGKQQVPQLCRQRIEWPRSGESPLLSRCIPPLVSAPVIE